MPKRDEMKRLYGRDDAPIQEAQEAWQKECLEPELSVTGEWTNRFETYSGIPVQRLYTPADMDNLHYTEDLGFPGQYPFTRGDSSTMYRGAPPRIYAYSGCPTAEQTNARYKHLLEQGARELIIASDLPTQIGYDSDHPLAKGEVSKIGCPINSLADVETIFEGIPLDKVFVGAQANANSVVMLAMILAAGEKQGVPLDQMKVLVQNDVLKEYFARGTQIFPPKAGLKLSVDCLEFVAKRRLKFMVPILYCGYHIREAGGSAVHEIAFTLSNAAAYIQEFVNRGLSVDELPPPRSLFVAGLDLFEEVAKLRAFRRMWARMLKERFGATNPRVLAMAHTCGSQASLYTAQQPRNNLVRGTIQALVQVLSGAKATYIATMDEALSIPTEESATLALRTMQIVHNECGLLGTADPLGGSYYLESLTSELEQRAMKVFDEIEAMGGAVAAIEQGHQLGLIAKEAYRQSALVDSGERMVVGVNKFQVNETRPVEITRVDRQEEARQAEKVRSLRAQRNSTEVEKGLEGVRQAARAGANVTESVLQAVRAYATMGEICGALREVYGEHR